jgi:hypothetical protein
MFWLFLYLIVAVAIPVWDAYIGFGFEFPDLEEGPNAVLTGIFWPIGLPIILLIFVSKVLSRAKANRFERQEKKEASRRVQERIRIAQEKEVEAALLQVEEEMQDVQAKGAHAR